MSMFIDRKDLEKFGVSFKTSLEWDVQVWVIDTIAPPKPICDCGAVKAKTTHVDWCSTVDKVDSKGGVKTAGVWREW